MILGATALFSKQNQWLYAIETQILKKLIQVDEDWKENERKREIEIVMVSLEFGEIASPTKEEKKIKTIIRRKHLFLYHLSSIFALSRNRTLSNLASTTFALCAV